VLDGAHRVDQVEGRGGEGERADIGNVGRSPTLRVGAFLLDRGCRAFPPDGPGIGTEPTGDVVGVLSPT
jgi:hypothetical protein